MPQIKPATHEAKGHLYYHPETIHRYNGLDPYWTVGSLLINEFDGYADIQTVLDGEHFDISLNYSKSGFAPRPHDDVEERLYEFELHLQGDGERKCHFNISPRFPEMQHYETGDGISVAFDHLDAREGITVQFQASNLGLDEIPTLLPRALQEIAEAAGTSFDHQYFREPQGGRIEELERYVRITREWNRKLIQQGGLFDRMTMLLSNQKGTKGEYKWDNEKEVGYNTRMEFHSASASKLVPHHSYGKQLKSYLPENPDNFDPEDALYHPKLGVLFRKSLNSSTSLRWCKRDELLDEIDETVINVLHWADIPVDIGDAANNDGSSGSGGGGNTVFVADDHFGVRPRAEAVPLNEDPLPRLEAEQDHLLMTVLRDMNVSDTEIVETVATDGGQPVDDLAESSGYSLSTIYRALQRLDGVLENREGHVRFVSQKIAEEIRGIVQSAEHAIESAADRAAKLFDIEVNQSANSAVSRWLAEYGAEFIPPEGETDRGKVRIDTLMSEYKGAPQPTLQEALDYLYHAWISDNRQRVDVDELLVEVDLARGEHYCAPLKTLR
ncbi:hypothetical protein SAMN05216226_102190 [Halovenus aranensis]|uniref:DUF7845 domain-containing protein n=1 Tax=Halovenus aranensis TaxID=890420 RepID=A0A1G8SZ12_9EURY|nr:hypothetical protein [Halovenus aranensis]SDJ33760.1 hypothetical protein SAMN05216226_102190 [Halovenus aranensis]